MKILIIGGSGFIGTRLTKTLLNHGHTVQILDKSKSQTYPHLWVKGDVRDKDSLISDINGCDVIYNLAAEHRDDVTPKSLYFDVNVAGAENVCDAADEHGIKKIIFTSSVAVYGFTEKETDESGELKPFNEYGKTKLEAEKVYYRWLQKGGDRSLIIIRPTVVFGERNRGNVYNLLKQIVSGKFVMVGKGDNVKSIAYIENVAAFLVHTLNLPKGYHLFNYADKPDLDMNTLVSIVKKEFAKDIRSSLKVPYAIGYAGGVLLDLAAKATNRKFPISAIRIKKFCSNTQFSSSSIQAAGFVPPYTLEESIRRTIHFEFLSTHKPDTTVFYSE